MGRCFCFWWPWDWKVPSDIPELKKFNLSAACAGVLQDIRCAYILQLMVTLVSKTAKNLLPIFDALRGNDRTMLTKCLRDLDTCMLSQEALCIGWTKGLEQLLNTRSISAHSVLVELKIKPVTPAALHLLGSGNQTSSENLGDTSDGDAHGDQPICLTINELLLFGSEGNDVVGTDQLHLLQLTLQTAIINAAIELENTWRSKLTIVIMPEDEKTTKGRKSGPPKSELLCESTTRHRWWGLPKIHKFSCTDYQMTSSWHSVAQLVTCLSFFFAFIRYTSQICLPCNGFTYKNLVGTDTHTHTHTDPPTCGLASVASHISCLMLIY